MSAEFRIDDSEFQATLRQYMLVTSRTLAQALNEKMFYIVRGASRNTPKTDREKIENQLEVAGYQLNYTKNGKRLRVKSRVRGAAIIGGTLVYKIINARRTFNGKPGLTNAEMREKSAKFLSARFRSVGTLKAGWWGALKTLSASVGQPNELKESQLRRIANPSVATVAKDGWKPEVSISYNVNAKDENHQRGIDRRVVEAFSGAWFDEMRKTQKHIEDKLSGALNKADKQVASSGKSMSAIMSEARAARSAVLASR